MSRLQKKCFLVSAGMHVLLPMILVLGSALTPANKPEQTRILEFIPVMTTDDKVSGGGNAQAHSAPAEINRPLLPTPTPPEPPRERPERNRQTEVAELTPDPESFQIQKENNKRRLPNVPTTPTTRRSPNAKTVAKTVSDPAPNREADNARKLLANLVGNTRNSLRENASSTTAEFEGPGATGIPYANFLDTVKTVYTRAWSLPDEINDDDATTFVSVTIDKAGNVVRSTITRKSGNGAVDSSVQRTLDRVRYVAPLPTTAKEDERTVTIGFNVKAKRGI